MEMIGRACGWERSGYCKVRHTRLADCMCTIINDLLPLKRSEGGGKAFISGDENAGET